MKGADARDDTVCKGETFKGTNIRGEANVPHFLRMTMLFSGHTLSGQLTPDIAPPLGEGLYLGQLPPGIFSPLLSFILR